jgi:hypothetical protein
MIWGRAICPFFLKHEKPRSPSGAASRHAPCTTILAFVFAFVAAFMLSSHSNLQIPERPSGVAAIVAACALFSAIAFVFSGLLFAHAIPLSAGAFLLGGGMEQFGPFAFLLYGVIVALVGIALWRRWKGARRAAVVLAAAGIALHLPAISSAVTDIRVIAIGREGAQIMVRVVVIFYLTQEPVKEWFANHQLANTGHSDDTTKHEA